MASKKSERKKSEKRLPAVSMNRTGAQFNRVSGRKEHGSAVTAKVYTLGNSFELCGRDFYERDRSYSQAIKENRLNANERRRRANRLERRQRSRQRERSRRHRGASRIASDTRRIVNGRSDDGYDQRASAASWEGRREFRTAHGGANLRTRVRRSTSANRHQRDGARQHRVPSQARYEEEGWCLQRRTRSLRSRTRVGGRDRNRHFRRGTRACNSPALARRMQRRPQFTRQCARGGHSPVCGRAVPAEEEHGKRDEYLSLLLGKVPAECPGRS